MIVKKIINKILPVNLSDFKWNLLRLSPGRGKAEIARSAIRIHYVKSNHRINAETDYVRQAEVVSKGIALSIFEGYIYPYDKWLIRCRQSGTAPIVSITPDYGRILKSSLSAIWRGANDSEFKENSEMLIEAIRKLSLRITVFLIKEEKKGNERCSTLNSFFNRMLENEPDSLDEAIQKLLFYNALFWQLGHWHNGLGRLDLILNKYYEKDLATGRVTRSKAKEEIRRLCKVLGKDTKAKSLSLVGDTGQYILLGGIDENGKTVHNDLTKIFLEVFEEEAFADPKLILRINSNTSDVIWSKAVNSILTGCGSPLLMNEELIMKSMIEFGYSPADVWNVGTSACWEPLIIGKSFDQNNPLPNIPIIRSLNDFLAECKNYDSFNVFLKEYKPHLKAQMMESVHDVRFDVSPLYSLFFDDCNSRKIDFTKGGAVYSYHGIQVVSFPNLINALLNIKYYVFEKNYISIQELAKALRSNFEGYQELRVLLLNNPRKFGSADDDTVSLTNELMLFISKVAEEITLNGNKVKVGFSSSGYISMSKGIMASPDGRKDNTPFAVHISPVSSKIDINEVLNFATKLNYGGNRINGNVVDFIVPTSFAKHQDKLRIILKNAMQRGVYELQLNVLDAETLADAKRYPDKYPNLIVRVWGFSAYFNDLPDEYKDNLIERARLYA